MPARRQNGGKNSRETKAQRQQGQQLEFSMNTTPEEFVDEAGALDHHERLERLPLMLHFLSTTTTNFVDFERQVERYMVRAAQHADHKAWPIFDACVELFDNHATDLEPKLAVDLIHLATLALYEADDDPSRYNDVLAFEASALAWALHDDAVRENAAHMERISAFVTLVEATYRFLLDATQNVNGGVLSLLARVHNEESKAHIVRMAANVIVMAPDEQRALAAAAETEQRQEETAAAEGDDEAEAEEEEEEADGDDDGDDEEGNQQRGQRQRGGASGGAAPGAAGGGAASEGAVCTVSRHIAEAVRSHNQTLVHNGVWAAAIFLERFGIADAFAVDPDEIFEDLPSEDQRRHGVQTTALRRECVEELRVAAADEQEEVNMPETAFPIDQSDHGTWSARGFQARDVITRCLSLLYTSSWAMKVGTHHRGRIGIFRLGVHAFGYSRSQVGAGQSWRRYYFNVSATGMRDARARLREREVVRRRDGAVAQGRRRRAAELALDDE